MAERRTACHVPQQVHHRPKWQLVLDMVDELGAFRPGSDFLHEMQQATSWAGRTIAVLSPAYLGSAFGEAE